jgi:L-galactose dehydrogenase
VDESLQRLGVDVIDLIQCHDIEFGSLDQIVKETLPALERLRAAGKVRFIGITGLPLAIFPYVLDRANVDTILSYCRFTPADRGLATLLPVLASKQIGVINASPLTMGLLTNAGPPSWHPAPPELKDAARAAARLCRDRGANISDLALRFALYEPRIASTLVGMSDRETLNRNLACVGGPPNAELLAAVEAILAPVRDLSWQSGRPENNDPA